MGFDLLSGDGFEALNDFRVDRKNLVQIAETPFSRVMGKMRRELWADMDDPSRPEHPPTRYLVDHGRYKTEPQEHTRGGPAEDRERQERELELEERHKQTRRPSSAGKRRPAEIIRNDATATCLITRETGHLPGQPAPKATGLTSRIHSVTAHPAKPAESLSADATATPHQTRRAGFGRTACPRT